MKQKLLESDLRELLLWLISKRRRFQVTGNSMLPTLISKRRRFQVTGNSMLPTLPPGTKVLVNPHAYRSTLPQVGEVIIARNPQDPQLEIIKRIDWIEEPNKYFVLGDNLAMSSDSRSYGFVEFSQILGKVTSYLP